MSNRNLIFAIALLVTAHLVVLLVLFTTRRSAMVLGLNAAVAVGAIAYVASRLRYVLVGPDWQMLAFVGAELAVLALAAAAYSGWRFTMALSYAAFGLHLSATAATMAFALMFRWPRLF